MAKIQPLADVGSLANTTAARAVINDNSQKIEDAFQNTLSRDGSAPNQMEADFDLNGHYLLNVADPINEADGVNLRSVRPLVELFASEIVETAVFGTQVVDTYAAASVGQTTFSLSQPPGSVQNIEFFVGGSAKRPGIDFTISGPTLQTLTLTTPLAGGELAFARYSKALPSGVALSESVTYTPPSTGINGTVKSFLDSLWTATSSAGAALIRFLQAGTGAVARTVQDSLRDRVSVLDFIPVAEHSAIRANTSTYDATANIQTAINAVGVGGVLFFPQGTYLISAELTITASGIRIEGGNRYRSSIVQNTLNARIFNITGQYVSIEHLGLSYGTGTPVAGATAIRSAGFYNQFRDILVRRSYVGFEFTTNGGQKLRDFECHEYESVGILVTDVNDVFISGAILNAGSQTRGLLGGIRLADKAEAVIVQDVDILSGKYSMTTAASSYATNARPAYNNFSNCFFDSSEQGTLLNNIVMTEFVGCWFSAGRAGVGFPGCTIQQSDSLTFTNTRFFNCGSHGVQVETLATRVRFIGCKAESNGKTAAGAAGFNFVAVTNFEMLGCVSRNGMYGSASQAVGFSINGASNAFRIVGGQVEGNLTTQVFISGGASNYAIQDVIGYRTKNIGVATVNSGSAGVTVSHGLNVTPTIVHLTARATPPGHLFVTNITGTQFTINFTALPGANIDVSWTAEGGRIA